MKNKSPKTIKKPKNIEQQIDVLASTVQSIEENMLTKADLKGMATKEDLKQMVTKSEMILMRDGILTAIDRFVKLHETLDHELISLRSKYERLEERVETLERTRQSS